MTPEEKIKELEKVIQDLKLVIEDLEKQLLVPSDQAFGLVPTATQQAHFPREAAYASHLLYRHDRNHMKIKTKLPDGSEKEDVLKGFYLDVLNLSDLIVLDTTKSKAEKLFLMFGRQPDPGTNPHTFNNPNFTVMVLGLTGSNKMVLQGGLGSDPVVYEYLTPETLPCSINTNTDIESKFP